MAIWQTVPMGELCSIQSGKSDTKDAVPDGPYAFFDRSKTIKRSSRFLRDCEALIIPGEGAEFLPRYFEGKFDLHQRAYALFDFSPRIEVKFLYHYLHHVADYFPSVAVGATVKSLRLRHFEQLPVRLTDPATQRRIIAILDEAFEGIATAKANAEKNLQNARELFETFLSTAFETSGDFVPLSTCAAAISDGDHAPPPKSPTGVPFITISNIDKETRRIDFDDTFSVGREYFNALKPHRKPMRGDVLYTVTGSFGIPILVEDDREFCFQRHIGLIRPKAEIDSRWLMYALLSPQGRAQAEAGATGTAQRTVSLSVLRAMTVPKLDLEEQRRIAARMDALTHEIGSLKDIVRSRFTALDELKKSLLHQAFSGQL